jgi:uncharacterized protein (DUF2141 family)
MSSVLARLVACAALPVVALVLVPRTAANTVTVNVPGPLDPKGTIGCNLFSSAPGFPGDGHAARGVWVPARAGGASCVFRDVSEGVYAVSVLLDLNGNGRVDTNIVGMPEEPWGVSNNARPTRRAPRFDECTFRVAGYEPVEIHVRVQR